MTTEEFYLLALGFEESLMGFLQREYQMEADDAADLIGRYIVWGAEKDWTDYDTHTIEHAIYKIRSLMSRDNATLAKANIVVASDGGDSDLNQEGVIDLLLAATPARIAGMLDCCTDEEYHRRVDRLHLLTDHQREVVRAFLIHHTDEAGAKALGIGRSSFTEARLRAEDVLRAGNPEPSPHKWERHDAKPNWCRPGYRQLTPWYDADENDYCAACTSRDRDLELSAMERSGATPSEMEAFRSERPFQIYGHKHYCQGGQHD